MTQANIRLGRILGIPVYLDRSWFIIFLLLTWLLGGNYYPAQLPDRPAAVHYLMGAVTALFLFASVLLHELGHSVVALWYRMPVHNITLFLFGGVARLGSEPPGALAEFLIAIAGPLVSLLLAVLFHFLQPWASFSLPLLLLAGYLSAINAGLFMFNLIPGYPLDGGRVFRALVWKFTGSLRRATFIAAQLGRVFGGLFFAWALWRMFNDSIGGGIWIALLGWFLYGIATQAARANRGPD